MRTIRTVLLAMCAVALLPLAMAKNAAAQEAPAETPAAIATEPAAAEPSTPPETPPAVVEAAVVADAEATPPAETGRVVFFRPSRLTGAVYTYAIREVGEDGRVSEESPRIGRLSNGSYFEYDAPAGIHNYNISGPMAINKAEDRLRIEIEPGETYYVEQTVRMGLITGGFRLIPADQARYERHDSLRQMEPRQEQQAE